MASRRAGGSGADGASALPSQHDVLVVSRGPDGGMLELRMALVAGCWSAGVRATLVPREQPSLTEQYEYAADHGIRWLVIVEEGRVASSNTCKVCVRGGGHLQRVRVHTHRPCHARLLVCTTLP